MRSESFKPTSSSANRAGKPATPQQPASDKLAEDEIPDTPPPTLRAEYLKVSWAYVYWCAGMLVWSILCVVYFIMTHQMTDMIIGLALGALLVAMIVLPAMLFGGKTWYKRLGWMMLLLSLFSLMWVYPIVTVGWGIRKRIAEGRYHGRWSAEDIWHMALSGLTIIVSFWTLSVTWRCLKLVRRLYRGDFGVTEVKVRH